MGIRHAALLAASAVVWLALIVPARAAPSHCLAPARWYSLAAGEPAPVAAAKLLRAMAGREVVLLGEHHDRADDHRWQMQTLAALALLHPNMVIGFEAFPRRVQPVLDRWVAGELDEQQFLAQAQWKKVWNFPPELYMPLFEFARLNRIPMVALNVDQGLVKAVGSKGWDGVPQAQREGLTRPAPASAPYQDMLFGAYRHHPALVGKGPARRDSRRFAHFVQSQLVWDRAMAEALAARLRGPAARRPLVVGIAGVGHLRHGYGIAHQLRSLGVTRIATLLPVAADDGCARVEPGLADAVYVLPPEPAGVVPKPRLGVRIEEQGEGVTIIEVVPGSLAQKSGLKVGDRVVSAAGAKIRHDADLIDAVHAQPPGTWLPIAVRRGAKLLDLVIKFPPRS